MIAAIVFRTAEGVYSAASEQPGDVVGPFDCQGLAFASSPPSQKPRLGPTKWASFSRTDEDR